MKKLLALLLAAGLITSLAACGGSSGGAATAESAKSEAASSASSAVSTPFSSLMNYFTFLSMSAFGFCSMRKVAKGSSPCSRWSCLTAVSVPAP